MIGYKVVTKQGLKGPYQKSSILKQPPRAHRPLNAGLLALKTAPSPSAADRAGESRDPPKPKQDGGDGLKLV